MRKVVLFGFILLAFAATGASATYNFDWNWSLRTGVRMLGDQNGHDGGCAQVDYSAQCFGVVDFKCTNTEGGNFAQTGQFWIYLPPGTGNNTDLSITVGTLGWSRNNIPESPNWTPINFDLGATPPPNSAVTIVLSGLPLTTGYIKIDALISGTANESFYPLNNTGTEPESLGRGRIVPGRWRDLA